MDKEIKLKNGIDKIQSRVSLGRFLFGIRKQKFTTRYLMEKETGFRHDTAKSIEVGNKNYTVDNLISYCQAIDFTLFD